MFVIGDESRFNNSDVYEPSFVGDGLPVGRSQSIVTDNALDRNRYLIDNFEMVEYISMGSLSYTYKLRGKTTGAYYAMKCIRKLKYGK